MTILSPCKDCKNRHESCHGNCIKYMDYKQQLFVYNNKIKKEHSLNNYYIEKRLKMGEKKKNEVKRFIYKK